MSGAHAAWNPYGYAAVTSLGAGNLTDRFAFATKMGVREVDIWMNLNLGYTCEDAVGNTCWWDQLANWLKTP